MILIETGYHTQTCSSDPKDLFYKTFTPSKEVLKGQILILHGMQEHSGRYNKLANYLAESGFLVMIYDHMGHGKSFKTEQDAGIFDLKEPATCLINDAANMLEVLKNKNPTTPTVLVAHSMGSFIARNLLKTHAKFLSGVVLVGTGGRKTYFKGLRNIFKKLNYIAPKNKSFFNKVFSKINNKAFKSENSIHLTSWLSKSEENQKNFTNDPLCGLPFSYNAFYGLFDLYYEATKKGWYKSIPKSLPFLFVSGAEDPIGSFGKAIVSIVSELKKNGFSNVHYLLYKDMRHEILNEAIYPSVFKDITTWIIKEIDNHSEANR
ncbi:MAG TPA: lysophospholipase [Candidatus Sphingobacterium stercoripullorum]|uniref:Lysophospholipase n=1 Tax=Candidatus Sphingobacterium stercoripullorum TaxID=2838759 RepID=A0A9D2AZ85_9SPHI|nr:lysophospholipase [Candidatus Sphingobacterium stercoripullorum]